MFYYRGKLIQLINSFIVLVLDKLSYTVLTEVCSTIIEQFTMLYQGPKLWDSLSHSVIESNNIRLGQEVVNCLY